MARYAKITHGSPPWSHYKCTESGTVEVPPRSRSPTPTPPRWKASRNLRHTFSSSQIPQTFVKTNWTMPRRTEAKKENNKTKQKKISFHQAGDTSRTIWGSPILKNLLKYSSLKSGGHGALVVYPKRMVAAPIRGPKATSLFYFLSTKLLYSRQRPSELIVIPAFSVQSNPSGSE